MSNGNPLPHRPTVPTPGKVLDEDQYEDWIWYLKAMMRHDLTEAELASDQWEARKALLEQRVAQKSGHDAVILRQRSREDIVLSDTMDKWSFFERRTKLYAAVLEAEMATRLGGFGL